MISNLEHKLKFVELVDKMKDIKRVILLKNGSQENDAEHSYHLAMMVLTFCDDFPDLNVEKCLKFALVHDFVEIYAGDTPALVDSELEKTKERREKLALSRLKVEFGEVLPEIIDLISEYEEMSSKEAKFVYSLDKVQPIIQVVMEGGKSWHKWKYDFDKIKERQLTKIYPEFGLDKVLNIYFEKAVREKLGYFEK